MTIQAEIDYYNNLPVTFNSFIDVPTLSDGEIYLVCTNKMPAIPEKKWVPNYQFAICKNGEQVGETNLRIGYTEGLYYGGQIGYNIREEFRGNGYAARGVRLLASVAKAHDMTKLLITNNPQNIASVRVCEKLGAHLLRTTELPEWHDLKQLFSHVNIWEWKLA